MDFKRLCLHWFLLFVILHAPSSAHGMGKDSSRSLYAMSGERLLSSARHLAGKYAESGPCLQLGEDPDDCAFIDLDGIRYVAFEGSVVRIEADARFMRGNAKLPFGLKLGDSRSVVAKRLHAFRSERPVAELLHGLERKDGVVSAQVQDAVDGMDGFQFYLRFDAKNNLRVVGCMMSII